MYFKMNEDLVNGFLVYVREFVFFYIIFDWVVKGVDYVILVKDLGGYVKSGCGYVYEVIIC